MKLKVMPDFGFPLHLTPVDHCAQIALQLFFNPEAPQDVYNVVHQAQGLDLSLIPIAKELGIEIQPVPFSQFVAKLKEDDSSPLAPFKQLYVGQEEAFVETFGSSSTISALQSYSQHNSNFFKSQKLPKYISGLDRFLPFEVVMRQNILYMKEAGAFQAFGIVQNN